MSAVEQWLPAPGFEGYYSVSNFGRVKSHSRFTRTCGGARRWHEGVILAGAKDPDGYPRVMFRIDGKHHTRAIHRLVCEVFNGPPNILHTEVHHIDRDRGNARADNLRWVSHTENINLRTDQGWSSGEHNGFARLNATSVLLIHDSYKLRSAQSLADEFGVSRCTIYGIWTGKRWASVTGVPAKPVSRSRPNGFNRGER